MCRQQLQPLSRPPSKTKQPKHPHTTLTLIAPTATPTDDGNKNVTDVIKTLHRTEKDNKALKLGLGLGLGLGIPSAAVTGWIAKTLSLARSAPEVMSALSESLSHVAVNNMPGSSGSGASSEYHDAREYPGSDTSSNNVDNSGDQIRNDMTEDGNIEDWPEEARNNWRPSQAQNEFTGRPPRIEGLEDIGFGVDDSVDDLYDTLREEGYNTEEANELVQEVQDDLMGSEAYTSSFDGANEAADVIDFALDAASGGSSKGIADALVEAGVPAGDVASTTEAITAALNALRGQESTTGSAAEYDAALEIISKAVTPRQAALSNAASVACGGRGSRLGASLTDALRRAGVPEVALESTAAAVKDAVQAGKASGLSDTELHLAATDAIADALPPGFFDTSSGGLPAPSKAVSRALLNVIGASYNFWHAYPTAVYDMLRKLEDKSPSEVLKNILANGPPPETKPYRGITFPYQPKAVKHHDGSGKVTDSSPSTPPKPTGKGSHAVGYCANLTEEELAKANKVVVYDPLYEDPVDKTSLTDMAR
ncbi:hypothetical protein UCDDA912_g06765 [Diaporthe ampelina]|uniref:Uncharacterized protein n=1 Tax=Diaporthe ampelina TaxID=1214573 RepID=A0A0G2HZ82_9PEZI|nr:hypothetical protein UCDDA912_g06765 [Diaporthe ampelina]